MIKHFLTIHDDGGDEHVINLSKVLYWTTTNPKDGCWLCRFYFEDTVHEIPITWEVFNNLAELPEFFV